MITKFNEYINESTKQEREKLHRKELYKYLNKEELKERSMKKKTILLNKRKRRGSQNDEDIKKKQISNFQTILADTNKNLS